MPTLRFNALKQLPFIDYRKDNFVQTPHKLSELYRQNVFSEEKMREYLTQAAFQAVMNAIQKGIKIEREIADQVAQGMKSWAMTMGVTHYTHWFQPLTGATAEKHDSFFTPVEGGSRAIDLMELTLFSKSQMHLHFQMEELEILLRRGGIQLGILHRQLLLWVLHFVFLLFLFLIQGKHWTIRLRYLELYMQ